MWFHSTLGERGYDDDNYNDGNVMYVTLYGIDNHNDERVAPGDRDRRIGGGQDRDGGEHWRIQHYFADMPAWLVLEENYFIMRPSLNLSTIAKTTPTSKFTTT